MVREVGAAVVRPGDQRDARRSAVQHLSDALVVREVRRDARILVAGVQVLGHVQRRAVAQHPDLLVPQQDRLDLRDLDRHAAGGGQVVVRLIWNELHAQGALTYPQDGRVAALTRSVHKLSADGRILQLGVELRGSERLPERQAALVCPADLGGDGQDGQGDAGLPRRVALAVERQQASAKDMLTAPQHSARGWVVLHGPGDIHRLGPKLKLGQGCSVCHSSGLLPAELRNNLEHGQVSGDLGRLVSG